MLHPILATSIYSYKTETLLEEEEEDSESIELFK
jgi:hypothetical protein